jgi:hypothetical protein
VKEVKLMHLVLKTEDGTREILIPSGNVVTQIIQKKRSPAVVRTIKKTVLTLDVLSPCVTEGSSIVFIGKLIEEATGNPVTGVTVKVFDRDFAGDDLLASGITQKDGSFNIEWIAKKTDLSDNKEEVYAKFEGNDNYMISESKQHIVTIEGKSKKSSF